MPLPRKDYSPTLKGANLCLKKRLNGTYRQIDNAAKTAVVL